MKYENNRVKIVFEVEWKKKKKVMQDAPDSPYVQKPGTYILNSIETTPEEEKHNHIKKKIY